MDKNKLEKLQEICQEVQKQADRLKATYRTEMGTVSELLRGYVSLMDQMVAITQKSLRASHADFLPSNTYLENIKHFVEKMKAYISRKDKELGAKTGDSEEEEGTMNKLIKFLEENQAEL